MSLAGIKFLARPDQWALHLGLKVDGRPFSLQGAEYITDIMRDTSRKVVIRKAAQTRFTISFLVRTFHWIVEKELHHLYLLPLKTGAVPFVQKRIDPIISSNPHLAARFKAVDNRTHKQTVDNIALLIRGTNVESELQETPADCVVFDEFDRMVPDYLEDAKHRTDGSPWKRLTYLSTPSEPGHGLDDEEEWHASDQHHWEIECPHCGRFQFVNRHDNLKIGKDKYDCVLECTHCKREFSDELRKHWNSTGRWVPYNLDGKFRGYCINQFCSPTMPLEDIMDSYFNGQSDQKALKSWFNQSMGEPYVVPGNQITEAMLKSASIGDELGGIPGGYITIGVDVGHDYLCVLAYWVDRYNNRHLWQIHKFVQRPGRQQGDDFAQLDEWLSNLTSFMCVIDAHPAKREAASLSVKYPGRVFLGFEMDRPQTELMADFKKVVYSQPSKVTIDRTMAFDTVIHDFINGKVVWPKHSAELGEHMARRQYNGLWYSMMQMVRVEEENVKGITVAMWKKNRNADHWHHADMFSRVAQQRKPTLWVPPSANKAIQQAGSLVGV